MQPAAAVCLLFQTTWPSFSAAEPCHCTCMAPLVGRLAVACASGWVHVPVEGAQKENPGEKARPGDRLPWPSTQPCAYARRSRGGAILAGPGLLNARASQPTRRCRLVASTSRLVGTSQPAGQPAHRCRLDRRAGIDGASRPASKPARRCRLDRRAGIDEPAR